MYWGSGERMACPWDFNPLTSDSCCMMAWSKFSATHLTFLSGNTGENKWLAGWTSADQVNYEFEDDDYRRAMCYAMAKAVTK